MLVCKTVREQYWKSTVIWRIGIKIVEQQPGIWLQGLARESEVHLEVTDTQSDTMSVACLNFNNALHTRLTSR